MPQNTCPTTPAAGIVFFIVYALFMLGMLVGYVVVMMAMWRGMKAHEKIAAKLSEIADKIQAR